MRDTLLATTAMLLLAAPGAHAAEISFSDSVALASTNWTETLTVSQFDSSLGVLESVMITLDGGVTGSASLESLDAAAATITANLQATIDAFITNFGAVGTVLPIVSASFDASAFDGGIDFGGTSGTEIGPLSGTDTDTNTFTSGLDAFIGTGTLDIEATAEGASAATGAGNVITLFGTEAEAEVTVKYTYTAAVTPPPVPLPAGIPLMLGALGLLGLAKRRAAA